MNTQIIKETLIKAMGMVKGTPEYDKINLAKSEIMELEKSKLNEMILFFKEGHLDNIPFGYSDKKLDLSTIPMYFGKRSLCEYEELQRHCIPYMLVKHSTEDKYFFIFREGGSNELRLIGKKGMSGGHVGIEDYCEDINKVIASGMWLKKEEILSHINEFEDWSQQVIKNYILG